MTALTHRTIALAAVPRRRSRSLSVSRRSPRRRFALTARTPRELVVPLLTPVLFALVIAPALKRPALHTSATTSPSSPIGTIGLLIPLNAMFSGLSVIVDRDSGAQRELLAAPIPAPAARAREPARRARGDRPPGRRAARVRGAARDRLRRHRDRLRLVRRRGRCSSRSAMYGVAETLASRVPRQEEYVARAARDRDRPVVLRRLALPDQRAAGRPRPGSRRFLPLTHALALMRYGLLGDAGRPARHLGHRATRRRWRRSASRSWRSSPAS